MNHLRFASVQRRVPDRARDDAPIDAIARTSNLPTRSKLTGSVMKKGKGVGPRLRPHVGSVAAAGRPVTTRLTSTMAFVELSRSPCMPGSPDAPDDEADPAEGLDAPSGAAPHGNR